MPRTRPVVIVTRKLPDVIETRMMELFDARLNTDDQPLAKAALIEAVKGCDVLVPTVTDRIDSSVLAHAGERLRLIANYGTGVDNIDVEAAYKRGITVTNTPGVLTEDTADMTMALILAVSRRLAEGERLARSGEWARLEPDLDARASDLGQAARHRRHGPDRQRRGAPRQGLRPFGALSQPPARSRERRAGARGHLLGEPRPDAGAHGRDQRQLPAHAGDLPPALGTPAGAAASRMRSWSTPAVARWSTSRR